MTKFLALLQCTNFITQSYTPKNYIFDVSGSPGCLSSGKREEFDPDGNQGLQQERPEGPHCLLDSGQKRHGMSENSFPSV